LCTRSARDRGKSSRSGSGCFKALVLARIIEPTSKLDSLRVLAEAGVDPPSYRTVKRRLRVYAGAGQSRDGADDLGPEQTAATDPAGGRWRARLAQRTAAGASPSTEAFVVQQLDRNSTVWSRTGHVAVYVILIGTRNLNFATTVVWRPRPRRWPRPDQAVGFTTRRRGPAGPPGRGSRSRAWSGPGSRRS
jgi:hypothetical protein